MNHRTSPKLLSGVGAALLLIATSAEATVMYARTTRDMAKRADAMVVGYVKDRVSQWGTDETGTRIYSFTRIAVERTLKGKPMAELVVRQYGGTVNNVTMKVPGNAEFTVGERVVLFLRAGAGGLFHLPSLAASKFSVRFEHGKAYLVRSLEGIAFLTRERQNGVTRLEENLFGSRVSWEEFAKEIAPEVSR